MSHLTDELTGALIGLARASDGHPPTAATHRALVDGLLLSDPLSDAGEEAIRGQIEAVRREKAALIPGCAACASPCGRNADFDLSRLSLESQEVQDLKGLLLLVMRAMAPYADRALRQGQRCDGLLNCFYDGLFAVGEALNAAQLQTVLSAAAEANRRCPALLDGGEA